MDSSCSFSSDVNMQVHLKGTDQLTGNELSPRDGPPAALSSPGPRSRPKLLGDVGTPTRTRKLFELPGTNLTPPKTPDNNLIERKLKEIMAMSGTLTLNGNKYQSEMEELEDQGELGYGTSGHVVKMLHRPSNQLIAVKQMHRSGNSEENKRIAMDLEVVLKSHGCPYIVRCLGCFITDAQVWICMELMQTCFDKLLKRLSQPIPEPIIGKVALATVRALDYLKEAHGVIHRDVKPSNILLDAKGNVKLCDFGISGHLVNSKANTKNAGCTAYLAPERINPPDPRKPDYDIRADVWSLGITLVELATGVFPYPDCKSDFEVLSRVLQDDPPLLPANKNFSPEFRQFVRLCLVKDFRERPKYRRLLELPFLVKYAEEPVDVACWFSSVWTASSPCRKEETDNGSKKEGQQGGHKRSLSGASPPEPVPPPPSQSHSRFSPLRNLMSSPVSGRKSSGGGSSPLLLQRFYHQQWRHRSASLSPSRGKEQSGGGQPQQPSRKKLSAYLRLHLGGCGGGRSPEPEPDPVSATPRYPSTFRPTNPPHHHDSADSPSLSRRYISPVPPEPPPRRLSAESGGGSPLHLHRRLASLTPQPHRRQRL